MTHILALQLTAGIQLIVIIALWTRLRIARNNLQNATDTINRLLDEKSGLSTDSKRLRSKLTALKQKRYESGRIPK